MFTPIPIALVESNEGFARAVLQELLPQFIGTPRQATNPLLFLPVHSISHGRGAPE